jgi:hypothetical protein
VATGQLDLAHLAAAPQQAHIWRLVPSIRQRCLRQREMRRILCQVIRKVLLRISSPRFPAPTWTSLTTSNSSTVAISSICVLLSVFEKS